MTKKSNAQKNNGVTGKDLGGRPTKYRVEYNEQARKLCLLGYTDKDLADFFEVNESTINEWKKDFPDFYESLKAGKDVADAEVAAALYKRALGYSHAAVKIMQYEGVPIEVDYTEHYPPDTAACTVWLSNRQFKKWKKDSRDDDDKNREIVGFETVPYED